MKVNNLIPTVNFIDVRHNAEVPAIDQMEYNIYVVEVIHWQGEHDEIELGYEENYYIVAKYAWEAASIAKQLIDEPHLPANEISKITKLGRVSAFSNSWQVKSTT